MTARLTNPRQESNRNTRFGSFDVREEHRRDVLLRAAWMKIVAAFACRPSPRGPWDETATGDATPWRYIVAPCRNAIATALCQGNDRLVEQTIEAACAFCDALKADFRSMLPEREEESVVTLALLETEYSGVATVEAMRLVAHPSPIEAERAIEPLLREESALTRLLNRCQRLAREPQMRSA